MSNAAQADFSQVESRFFHRVFIGFTSLAIISLLISLAGREIGSEISMGGHTDNQTIHEIVIGNDVLNLPANMIRYPDQRRDGIAKRVDLYAKWPAIAGYSANTRQVFNNLDKQERLMFLTFDRRTMTRDMSGRFAPIYKSMIEGDGELLANGLTRYHLPEKAGFLNEYLYVGTPSDERPFVARCLDEGTGSATLAPCDRDIHVGDDLVMMVRFSPLLLNEWRTLDNNVNKFAASVVK